MTGEHYKQELLAMVREWTPDRMDAYIDELEMRLHVTKEMLHELKLIRRQRRKHGPKDTGSRSGT